MKSRRIDNISDAQPNEWVVAPCTMCSLLLEDEFDGQGWTCCDCDTRTKLARLPEVEAEVVALRLAIETALSFTHGHPYIEQPLRDVLATTNSGEALLGEVKALNIENAQLKALVAQYRFGKDSA